MNLKLSYYDDIKNKDLLDIIDDGEECRAKLTANKLEIEPDRKDPRNIKNIKNIKMVFGLSEGGCIILIGNLGCDFYQPIGGSFFVKRVYIDDNADYESIKGVEVDVLFDQSYPCRIDTMQEWLQKLPTVKISI